MKNLNSRLALAAAGLAAATLIPSAEAQTTPLYIIAGSSAQFNTLGYANFESPYLTGPNHWTGKSGSAISAGSGCTGATPTIVIHDGRSSAIVDEPGSVWIAWNAAEAQSPRGSGAQLSAFINVDSAVGVRAALAVPAAVLNITVPAGTCGAGLVPGTSVADSPIPATVLADLAAANTINVGAADIRAEDAKFATTRTLTAQGTGISNTTRQNVQGLGYGGASGQYIGYPIKSSRSTTTANPVDFALFGNDPISGQPADANIVELNVGAGPVMVFVNTTNTAAGHFGDASLNDIDEWPLAGLVSGKLHRTRDAFHATGLGDFPARVFIREPLSGTYNTFEYNIPNTVRELTSQEVGVTNVTPASGSAQNPLNENISDNGGSAGRSRAIGTGEMVKAVAAVSDSLGYAFWGYGNFAGQLPSTIHREVLHGGGKLHRTRDAFHATGLGDFPARVFIREPLSGTYNTFEYNIPNTVRELTSQEVGVTNVTPASGSAQNPLNENISDNGGSAGRSRAIGTGEMVKAVAAVSDSLGYAFWGYGNFAGQLPSTMKYLTVNGVDPLFNNYSSTNGAFPQKSGSTYPAIPFTHVADGSYPIWTIFRLVLPNSNNIANVNALISQAQADASTISDFIPFPSLGVFRSHYYTASVGPYNGHKSGFPNESGGDVGGAVLPIQEDLDTIIDTGFENYQELQ